MQRSDVPRPAQGEASRSEKRLKQLWSIVMTTSSTTIDEDEMLLDRLMQGTSLHALAHLGPVVSRGTVWPIAGSGDGGQL